MDQKLHIDALFLRLRAATTNKVAIINTSINIPSAFASSDGQDWGAAQVPEVRLKPDFQTSQVDPLEDEHFWQFETAQFITVSFISFCNNSPELEKTEFM